MFSWNAGGTFVGMATVVAAQGGASRMALAYMEEVFIGSVGGEATVLAHKDLGAPLAIGVLLADTVDLPHVGLEGAPLGEGLFTQLTPVGTNACVRAHVPLEVKGVVEALPTVPTGVSLYHAVAFEVTRQHSLQGEHLVAHGTKEVP